MRIGIASFGIISPLGSSNQIWKKVLHPVFNKHIAHFENVNIHNEDIHFENSKIDPKAIRRMDKQVIYSLQSGIRAIDNAKIDIEKLSEENVKHMGVCGGSTFAQLEFGYDQMVSLLESKGDEKSISMFTGISFYYGAATAEMSILLKSQGENSTITTGSSSGIDCVMAAFDNIKRKINTHMLAIGGENVNFSLVPDMLKSPYKKMWSMIDKKDYYYTSGAASALLCEINKENNGLIEIMAFKSYNASDCLFNYSDMYRKTIEKAIYESLDELNLKSSDIDVIFPGFNNRGDGDFYEVEALNHIFKGQKEKILIPKLAIGDLLSASGILNLFFAYKCMSEGIIPANKNSYRNLSSIDSLIVKETQKKDITYAMIIQRELIGGKVSVMIVKNILKPHTISTFKNKSLVHHEI